MMMMTWFLFLAPPTSSTPNSPNWQMTNSKYLSLMYLMAPQMPLIGVMPQSQTSQPQLLTTTMTPPNYFLTILTLWLMAPILLSSLMSKSQHQNQTFKLMLLNILTLILIMSFTTMNMLMFYIMFESSILPTLTLIMVWGYQPERLAASIYMLMYTITASLPLLIALLMMNHQSSLFIMSPPLTWANKTLNLIIIMAFLVKIPIYTLHLWLPKAHVEAPIAGSMILAGILLKLGVYGLLMMMSLLPSTPTNKPLIMSIVVGGGFLTSLLCPQLTDMKALIAYSSIAHMGLATGSALTSSSYGWKSSSLMMLTHGLISPFMFSTANLMYESNKTRSLFLISGGKSNSRHQSLWTLLMITANAGVPPNISFMSELMTMTSLIMFNKIMSMILLPLASITMLYSVFLYMYSQHNNSTPTLNSMMPSPKI